MLYIFALQLKFFSYSLAVRPATSISDFPTSYLPMSVDPLEPELKPLRRTNSGSVIVFDPLNQTLTTIKTKELACEHCPTPLVICHCANVQISRQSHEPATCTEMG